MEPANSEQTPSANQIQLSAANHGSIAAIKVYPSRAKITRIFKFSAQSGQNLVTIDGLPTVLDLESFRVEGRGPETIDRVTTSRVECSRPAADTHSEALNIRAVVEVFTEASSEVEIAVVYDVDSATWHPEYDIRVDMQAPQEQVTLIYKASISQVTGEDWRDVPLTLESDTSASGESAHRLEVLASSSPLCTPPPPPALREGKATGTTHCSNDSGYSTANDKSEPLSVPIDHRSTSRTSPNGRLAFEVPNPISVPCDGVAHSVTIAELKFKAKMTWICTPKKDSKTHLDASIKNLSRYTLLRGIGSIYIDGSFVSHYEIPEVVPEETFTCPLGFDQCIQVIYLPVQKKQSPNGFLKKRSTSIFTQNITVINTRSVQVDKVIILNEIPASEDSRVKVRLLNPPLDLPVPSHDLNAHAVAVTEEVEASVPISPGVSVTRDVPQGVHVPGDRKLRWNCSISPGKKVNLVLQWEVVAPIDLLGLMLAVCYP